MFDIRWSTVVSVPELAQTNALLQQILQQLLLVREELMEHIQRLNDALDGLGANIADEIRQWGQQQMLDPADVDALVARIEGMTGQVKDIIPGDPLPDEPTP